MAALLPPRFVAWLSLLKLLRVAVLVEAERRVLPPLAIAVSVFEGFILFNGVSFSTSPLLFLLPRPLFFDPISTVADSESLAARRSPPAGSEMDGSGGEIGSSLTWERVGGMGAKLTGKRVGEIGDGSSGENGTALLRVGEQAGEFKRERAGEIGGVLGRERVAGDGAGVLV